MLPDRSAINIQFLVASVCVGAQVCLCVLLLLSLPAAAAAAAAAASRRPYVVCQTHVGSVASSLKAERETRFSMLAAMIS